MNIYGVCNNNESEQTINESMPVVRDGNDQQLGLQQARVWKYIFHSVYYLHDNIYKMGRAGPV